MKHELRINYQDTICEATVFCSCGWWDVIPGAFSVDGVLVSEIVAIADKAHREMYLKSREANQ